MILLQAAMLGGLIILMVFGASIFIGIPLVAYLIYTIKSRRKNPDTKGVMVFESIVFAVVIVVIVLVIAIWVLSSALAYS